MTADILSKVPTDLFIGGTWRAASEGGRFDVTDPATGDVIAQVADASAEDGLAAVAAAHEAGKAWAVDAAAPARRGAAQGLAADDRAGRRDRHADLAGERQGADRCQG